ncbi:hypothetical protein CMV_020396 [Castanea mollissima]|uniref:Uncharacterized protein n=1 Tax=Castanea mollissima TaxID=60419 RepID=A0A8J4QW31_9ROSI|nr:hypothetical protein CMV_020396 [Castanea mollissima]
MHFPTSCIYHLDAFHSDHKPILLCSDSELKRFYGKGRPFCFKALWLKDSSCEDVVRDSWGVNHVEGSAWCFNKKMYSCQDNLRTLNHNTFGHVRNSLQRKLTKLKTMEESGIPNPFNSRLLSQILTKPILQQKRKVTKKEFALFAKRLKEICDAPEAVSSDPETVTIIPQVKLEHSIQEERHKSKGQGQITITVSEAQLTTFPS